MSWTQEQIDDLMYMNEQAFTRKEIKEVLNKPLYQINNKMKELGIRSPIRYKEKDGLYYCPDCKEYKPKEEFYRFSRSKHGISSHCKKHVQARQKDNYQRKKFDDISKKIADSTQPKKSKLEINGSPKRKCCTCKKTLSVELFNWKKTGISLQAFCKDCHKKNTRKSYEKRLREKGY